MYDFKNLSPLDFEDLARDLLQAHWRCSLESFGPGKDGGIDLRRADGPDKLIVQAKRYQEFDALLSVMKSEREKAIALNPTRYALATSVSLTPQRKHKLREAMTGVPLAERDIFGATELNALLRDHPTVELAHFKLWLASTAVLERILRSGVYNRTAAELDAIQKLVPRFVQNDSVGDAERLLGEVGALIIAGAPGVGKTTLAQILLWRHAEQGWKIFVVDDVDEAMSVANEGERRLIFFDDFLGQVRLSPEHLRGLDARLPPLLARVASHKELRFILTTRDYIFAQAKLLAGRLANAPDVRSYLLNVGTYTRDVKARILYNHIYFSELTTEQKRAFLDDDFYLKIIDHKNFNPRLIDMLTTANYLALTDRTPRESIEAALANPSELWERPFRHHLSQDARCLLLTIAFNGAAIPLVRLKQSMKRVAAALEISFSVADFEERFRTAYRELDGSAIGMVDQMVRLINPGLRDFLQGVIEEDNLLSLLLARAVTWSELIECFNLFRAGKVAKSSLACPSSMWLAAFERAESQDAISRAVSLQLALDLFEKFEDEEWLPRIETIAHELEEEGFEDESFRQAISLLENVSLSTMPYEYLNVVGVAVTRSAATHLAEQAWRVAYDDIESLTEALYEYGHDDESVNEALETALEQLSAGLHDELNDIDTIDELDSYESDLLKFMKKRGQNTSHVEQKFQDRRDHLIEYGERHRPSNYSSTLAPRSVGASDGEIRSLFSGLTQEIAR